MTQIRVRELASELNASTQQVLTILEDLGQKVRGPSTVIGVSAAAKVRGRFRTAKPAHVTTAPGVTVQGPGEPEAVVDVVVIPQSAVVAPSAQGAAVAAAPPVGLATAEPDAGARSSLFLPPVAPPAPVTVARSTGAFANPFTLPAPKSTRSSAPAVTTAPTSPRFVGNRVATTPLVIEPEPSFDAQWEARGIGAADQARWLAGGLRPSESGLADRCQAAGIVPEELSGKLSGRTALQRLRDGEAITSVWARIREAEQQPRRAGTKLTGRFS